MRYALLAARRLLPHTWTRETPAAAVLVVHNHPSGDPEPSREDLEVTERLVRAGRLLGIPLLDHLVVAEGGYVSLRERGWIRPGGGPASQV